MAVTTGTIGSAPSYAAVGWKIWFADGTTKAGLVTDLWQATWTAGVLCVWVYFNNNTSRVMSGTNFYFQAKDSQGNPVYASSDDTAANILITYPNAVILTGQWVSDAMLTQADNDMMIQANNYTLSAGKSSVI